VAQFANALGRYGVVFKDSEVQKLVNAYRLGDGKIDWERFCGDVESAKSTLIM
jgi:Ca2+-binding EF-hand superfamily protein